jgi:Fe-S-cluster containining protein
MELSSADIKRLEGAGYCPEEFAVMDGGVIRLRNVDGWCYFYSLADKKCRVYGKKPLGCYLYPVVYLLNEGAIVDGMSKGADNFRTRIEKKRKNPCQTFEKDG